MTLETAVFEPRQREERVARACRAAVERARAAGADQAEAYGTAHQEVVARFEKGELHLASVGEADAVGLRVLCSQRQGFSSTNQVSDEAVAELASAAKAVAELSPPDEHNRLPAARPIAALSDLARPELLELPVETAAELGQTILDRLRAADPRVTLDSGALSVARASRAACSSEGVDATETDAVLSFSVFGMAVDGDDVGGFDYRSDCLRELADFPGRRDRAVDEFVAAVLGNLGAQRAESYTGPTLFAPEAFRAVFLGPLVEAASALAVQRGRSALAEKLGQPIAHAMLDVRDDPTDAGLAGAGAFDREGQPTAPFQLVAEGHLAGYLYNGYAANVEGRESTGHAVGGSRAVPGLGAHALVVAPGSGGDAGALRGTLGRGLVVQRFSGTVDPTSGDFSGVAKSARWVEEGAETRPVGETLIAGNAFELLGRLIALSSQSTLLDGAARVPWALVDGVSVTAG